MEWHTPLGLPVVQPYRKKERQHVRTLLQVRPGAEGAGGRARWEGRLTGAAAASPWPGSCRPGAG